MTISALDEIHEEIDRLSERRADLWTTLSHGYHAESAGELKRIDAELDRLWDEHRAVRARLRFGSRDSIVARARIEERLERAA